MSNSAPGIVKVLTGAGLKTFWGQINNKKQDTLSDDPETGNIKTINGISIIGAGDIAGEVAAGEDAPVSGDQVYAAVSEAETRAKAYTDQISTSNAKIFSGPEEPSASIGKDGDIYLQYEE